MHRRVRYSGGGDRLRRIAGPFLREGWILGAGLSSAGWRGLRRRIVLSPQNSPAVAADGSNFRGRPVAKTALTGLKYWNVTGLSGFLQSGQRPCTLLVVRVPTVIASGYLTDAGAANTDDHRIRVLSAGTGYQYFLGAANKATNNGVDTTVQAVAAWSDGSSIWIKQGTAAAVSAASANALAASVAHLTLGSANSTTAVTADGSFAAQLIWSQYPGDARLAACIAQCKLLFGF